MSEPSGVIESAVTDPVTCRFHRSVPLPVLTWRTAWPSLKTAELPFDGMSRNCGAEFAVRETLRVNVPPEL
jgi:hypothetical protein